MIENYFLNEKIISMPHKAPVNLMPKQHFYSYGVKFRYIERESITENLRNVSMLFLHPV